MSVTVWRIALDRQLPQRLPLSPDEAEIAARFRFPRHGDRYRVAHWGLREILAAATGQPADALAFSRDDRGKPQFARGDGPAFNLSHAEDLALVAVADRLPAPGTPVATGRGVPHVSVGVDVDCQRAVPEMMAVANSHFAVEEREALRATPDDERLTTFYRIWTRKEAFVKATGSGVGPALARFAVTAAARDARILRADDYPEAASDWTLKHIALGAPYVGAVVVTAPQVSVELRDWVP
ncbi:MAG: 4'-phosphopantetheinyl transferase superfamily protein [Gemmatimonadaceae bacterium]|nr:4'-phosphopantetheinyl transferase superfamily protein [Gemmatimonadaceae bacterium]